MIMEGKENHFHFHPLLTKTIKESSSYYYSHGFSSSQIQVLASACDAFLPSISVDDDDSAADAAALKSYYRFSGGQPPLPDEVRFLFTFSLFQHTLFRLWSKIPLFFAFDDFVNFEGILL